MLPAEDRKGACVMIDPSVSMRIKENAEPDRLPSTGSDQCERGLVQFDGQTHDFGVVGSRGQAVRPSGPPVG